MSTEGLKQALDKNRQLQTIWYRTMKDAVDADEWGQTVEAVDGYERLLSLIDSNRGSKSSSSSSDSDMIANLYTSINSRLNYLKIGIAGGVKSFPVKDLKLLLDQVQTLFSPEGINDCVAAISSSSAKSVSTPLSPTRTKIRLHIVRIGLKDADRYVSPRIDVSIIDKQGRLIAPVENTPICSQLQGHKHIVIDHTLMLKTCREHMEPGFAIVFEFKHVKMLQGGRLSTRCWAFMETDEIKPDIDIALELYKKPTDLTRKRLVLHSVKPLYLHLRVMFGQ